MLGAAKVIRAVWHRRLNRDSAHKRPKPLYGLVLHAREGTSKSRSSLETGKEKTKPPGLTSTEKTPMNSYGGEKRKKGSNSASEGKKSKEEETRNGVIKKRRRRKKGCLLAIADPENARIERAQQRQEVTARLCCVCGDREATAATGVKASHS